MTNSKKARATKRRRNSSARSSQDFTNNPDALQSNDASIAQQKLHHGRRVSFDLSHNTVHILPSNKQVKLMIQERERQERERAAMDMIANDKADHGLSSSSEEDDATDAGDKDDTDSLGALPNRADDTDTPSDDTNSEDGGADAEEMAPTEQGSPSNGSNSATELSKKKRKRGKKGNSKKVHRDVEMFIDGPVIYAKEPTVETIEMDVLPDAEVETTETTAQSGEEHEAATDSKFLESIAFASGASEDESSPIPDVDELYYREKYFPDDLWAAIAEENNSQEDDVRSDVSVEGSVNSNSDNDSTTRAHRLDDIPSGPFFDYGTLDDGPSSAGSSPYSLLDEDEIDGEHGLGSLAIVTPEDDGIQGHTRGMIKGWLANTGGVGSKMDVDNERVEEPVAPWSCTPESLAGGDVH